MRPKGSPQELEARRRRAMELLDQGQRPADVARIVGVTRSAVSQWKKRFQRRGAAGIAARPHPGGTPKLSASQQRRLARRLLAGAEKAGFATPLWTLSRVAELIRREFGVTYDPSGIWHLLRRMGWSCQKPQRRAREMDEAAVQRWRTRDWPRIKKSRS
jgi:transposase